MNLANTRTPRVATWILTHLGSSAKNDQIIGDLIETYAAGRSRFWFWRQVIVAVLVGQARTVGAHRLLAVRAVAVGWLVHLVHARIIQTGLMPEFVKRFVVPSAWWRFEWTFPSALGYLLIAAPIFFFIGSIVATLHKRYAVAMVLTYLATLLIWNVSLFVVGLFGKPPFGDIPFFRSSLNFGLGNSVITFAVLCGGLAPAYGRRRREAMTVLRLGL